MSDETLPPESEQPEGEQPQAEPTAPLGATPPPLGGLPTPAGEPPPAPPSGPTTGAGGAPVTRRRRRAQPRRSFDFGRVLGGTFTVYFKKLPSILILSAIIAGPLGFLEVWSQGETFGAAGTGQTPPFEDVDGDGELDASDYEPPGVSDIMASMYVFFGALALEQLAVLILAGALAYLVVRDQQGRSVGIGEALGRGFSRLFPILGAGLLVMLIAVGAFVPAILSLTLLDSPVLGVLLLLVALVPALMFLYAAFVAIPACAVEGTGPVESIRRSRALCIGHRWLIFALALVLAIIGGAIAMVTAVPVAVTGNTEAVPWVGKIVEVLVTAPLGAILAAMVYVELRAVKEGVDPDGIAEVFA